MRIYVDTNIYLDYFLNRTDRLRPLGDFAFELFRRTISCEFEIILSDWVEQELKNNNATEQLRKLKEELKHKLITITTTKEDINQAKKVKPFEDSLHAILAEKAKAKYLITRNIKDFEQSTIKPIYPENV